MIFGFKHRLFMTLAVAGVASIVNAQSSLRHAEYAVPKVGLENLQPFTHTAFIPVGADLSSFRFRGVKAVEIPTGRRSTMDERYCAELPFRDPGGSMYCPSLQSGGFTRAYEITYSFEAPPLPSDEYGDRRLTFSVYFRPEELSPAVWATLVRRRGRTDEAESFELTTSRVLEERPVIDEDHTAFCEGNYRDGYWVRTNDQCEDKVTLKRVMAPSDYLAVQVEPTPSKVLALMLAK